MSLNVSCTKNISLFRVTLLASLLFSQIVATLPTSPCDLHLSRDTVIDLIYKVYGYGTVT